MNFGEAIEALKEGSTVARFGWNGKGMHLQLFTGGLVDPHITMKTAQGTVVPWVASQTDILADDWFVVSAAYETTRRFMEEPRDCDRADSGVKHPTCSDSLAKANAQMRVKSQVQKDLQSEFNRLFRSSMDLMRPRPKHRVRVCRVDRVSYEEGEELRLTLVRTGDTEEAPQMGVRPGDEILIQIAD